MLTKRSMGRVVEGFLCLLIVMSFSCSAGTLVYAEDTASSSSTSVSDGDKLIQLTPPTITSGGNSLTVKGRLVFYHPGSSVPEPIKWALVKVKDNEWFIKPDEVVASGYTDYNGYFSFSGINNDDGWLQGGRDIYVEVFAENYAADVVDNPQWFHWPPWEDPTYHANNKDDTLDDVADHSIIDFGTMSPEHPGAYNILNTVGTGRQFLQAQTGIQAPRVKVFFKDSFTPGTSYYMPSSIPERYSIPDWAGILGLVLGYSSFFIADMALEAALSSLVGIHIQDDDQHQWHEDVILHEYGHFVMDKYADFWPPDTKLTHDYTTACDPQHAWGEGWAHFFSAAARHWAGYSDYRTHDGYDIEYNYSGDSVEAAVAGILWDIYDVYNPSETADTLVGGLAYADEARLPSAFYPIWHILRTYNPPGGADHPWNIYDFWDGFLDRNPGLGSRDISGLWRIFDLHGVRIPDSVLPLNPTSYSSSHALGVPSWGDEIRITVSGDSDDLSGVAGYSVIWDNSPFTLPPETMNEVGVIISPVLGEGLEWYFHLRTVDYAGNWATDTLHGGPFLVKIETIDDDTTGPIFSNPASYFEEQTIWTPPWGDPLRVGILTLSIDVTDPSGISEVAFFVHNWYEFLVPFESVTGDTYWTEIQFCSWIGPMPHSGQTIHWVVFARDDDNEGWRDKAMAISPLYSTQLEAPPDGFGASLGVDISIEPSSSVVEAGGFTTYQMFISNTGNIPDTYSLTLQGLDPSWSYSFSTDPVEVWPGQTESVTLTVAPPYVPMILEDYEFTVTATSLTDPSVFDTGTARALVISGGPSLIITADSPVNILVATPSGLRVGYDPETGATINEIPGAMYSGLGSEPQVVQIPNSLVGHYKVDTFGTGIGPYTITIESLAFDGSTIDTVTWTGTTELGQHDTETMALEPKGTIADIAPPTTESTLIGTLGLNDWYRSDVVVTLTATDYLSGVALTQYSFDGSMWITYTGQFTINVEGTTTIYFNSTDNVGNVEEANTVTLILDKTPPTTTLTIGEPKYISDETYVTPDTPFTLEAIDAGSGVYSTAYRIYNAIYDSGWQTYTVPFKLTSLTDGTYTIEFNSTDNAGNIETTHAVSVTLDNSEPSITVENPLPGWALQDGVTFIASTTDSSGTQSLNFSIREANGDEGTPVGFENIPATYNAITGKWELFFDTLQLPDGYYVVLVSAEDQLEHTTSIVVPYSIRNWAVIELLPSSGNNKAGRTMPVKFALRVAAEVDPNQPFVYNEELRIEIYATHNPAEILQESYFGDTSRDYRISRVHYITNFKTPKTPKEYTVAIYRNAFDVGSFTFKTTK